MGRNIPRSSRCARRSRSSKGRWAGKKVASALRSRKTLAAAIAKRWRPSGRFRRRVDGLKSQLLGEQGRSIQYNIIQRDVDTNRALYDALLQRYKEVGIAGGVGTNNISIVDRALPPARPYQPRPPAQHPLSRLILGLCRRGSPPCSSSNMDESESSRTTSTNKLGVPLLGVTPRLAASVDDRTALGDPKSPLAEAYFSILTVAAILDAARHAPVTLLTSAQAQRRQVDDLAGARARASPRSARRSC